MDLLKIAQAFNSTSKEQRSELLKAVDVNYCIPDAVLGKQNIRKKWAGYTSLHIAVMENDIDLTNELLDRGADLLKQATIDGRTPLHVALDNACAYGLFQQEQRHSLINALLTRQVESNNIFNPKCKRGISHFHIACVVNHINAVEFFVKAKEPLHQPINCDSYLLQGYTPLHCAIKYSSVEVSDILLQHGANICFENPMGLSCLHLLVECILNVSDLIQMGMRTLCMPYERETERLESIIKLVLKTRVNDGIFMDDTGLSALHIACTLKDKSIAEDFLKKGVNVNIPVKSESQRWPGWTPLHFAACSNLQMMILLMQNGANILTKNCEGETALDLCAKRFTPADIQLILSMKEEFRGIVLSDTSTKLSDLLVSMNTCVEFNDFLEKLIDINIVIPLDLPIWPGYSLLHLAVSLNDRTIFSTDRDDKSDSAESDDSIPKRYNCTKDEESLYVKRIELLLEYGCNVSLRNVKGQTPIHLAFGLQKKATVEQLLSYSRVNVVDQNGLSHLHIACVMGNLYVVKRYLSRGADVNGRVRVVFDWYSNSLENVRVNSTPLHFAVSYHYLDVVEHLLAYNADVYAQDSLGFTPIHLSISTEFNSKGLAKLLLGATQNLQDSVTSGGLSHLHVAAWANEANSVKKLLLNGAQIDRVVEANVCSFLDPWVLKTPLLVAVVGYSDKVVNTLLKAGANVYAKDAKGISAMKFALRKVSMGLFTPFVQMVKAGKFEVESCGITLLHVACGDCDIEWARELLNKGADVNARLSDDDEWNGATPLYMLIHTARMCFDDQGLVDFVELLIDEGADVTLECSGVTPIHLIYNYLYACPSDYEANDRSEFFLRSLDLLLKSHKSHDVNPSNHNGLSHFHCACVRNDVETVVKFLNHGINVNEPIDPLEKSNEDEEEEISGFTALHFAMAHRSREVAHLLLDRGADVNAEDANGNKPLHVGIKNKFVDLPLIETMLSLGADVHAKNLSDISLLYCLLESDNLTLRTLEFFLTRGCLMNALGTTGRFRQGIIGLAMRSAAPTELLPILERLIKLDEIRNAIQNGFNAIQSIVAVDGKGKLQLEDYLNAVELFINNGCDLDQQSADGVTALYAAAFFNNLEALNALLQLGADINVANNENACPFADYMITTDDDDIDPYERKVYTVLASHVWKMRLTGLELSESNLSCLEIVEEKRSFVNLLEQSCQDELTKATNTTICEGLTVRDFLSELGAVAQYPRICVFQQNIINKYFKCTADLRREFPEFCGILTYQYRKALTRMELWQSAKAAVHSLCQVELPDLCLEAILRFFTNSEMKFIIELAEELN